MIATGIIGDETYEVHVLTEAALPQIELLQQAVVAALPDPNILQPLSEEELRFILQGNGVMIGLYIEETLIAFRALLRPEVDDEHLGYDIGLDDTQLSNVLYQEISNVHPNYRGYGLQRKMADYAMSQVDTSMYPIICATVMPYNIASLKDKFSQGMHVAALKYKYGGKLRYVFAKYLTKQLEWTNEVVEVEMNETALQQNLLKNHFLGVQMVQKEAKWFVIYKKIK